MKKRGKCLQRLASSRSAQVTVFLIVGIVVLIIIGMFYYLSNYGVKSKIAQAVSAESKPSDADIVKAYAESCLKLVSDNALFDRIGLQGGLIEPAGAPNYNEPALIHNIAATSNFESKVNLPHTLFAGKNVPFYLEATCDKQCINWVTNPGGCTPAPVSGSGGTANSIRVDTNNPGIDYYVTRPDGGIFGERGSKTFAPYTPGVYGISPDTLSGYTIDIETIPSNGELISGSYVNFVINYEQCTPESTTCTKWKCNWNYKEYPTNPANFMDDASQKISNYVEVEFLNCFNRNNFNDIDIKITPQVETPVAETKINKEDVVIKIDYPLAVKRGISELNLDSFEVRLPIRLLALHESAKEMSAKIKTITETEYPEGTEPDASTQLDYNIVPDCDQYDTNTLTNVYVNAGTGGSKIVQFSDFSTYFKNYFKTYIFQAAVKGVNIIGDCVGS